jgi:hypothetical protein
MTGEKRTQKNGDDSSEEREDKCGQNRKMAEWERKRYET